jgi:predicted DNA-binding protein
MQRTNIYLSDEQLELLRRLSERRGEPVAVLVREALDQWLRDQGARPIQRDEWERRFDALLRRRDEVARRLDVSEEDVGRDVMEAVREVRRARAARRR